MSRIREAAHYRRPVPRRRMARWLLLGILGITVAWLTLLGQLRVVGMGYVETEEIALSPEFEGRIAALHVTCHDRVREGQLLALVTNPIRAHTYQGDLVQEETDARVRQALHAQRLTTVNAQLEAARRRLQAMEQHRDTVAVLLAATEQAWQANGATLTERVAARNADVRARAGVAAAEATVRRREAELARVRTDAATQMAGFAQRVDAQRIRAGLGAGYEIRSPFEGVVTDCPRDVGDMVRPSVAVVRLQRRHSARLLVWIPAPEVSRVKEGMSVDVVLSDNGRHFPGLVSARPAEVGSLPRRLKRYFWQNQAWQQYARIEITPVNPADAAELAGDTRLDAVIRTTDLLRLPVDILENL